MIGQTLSAEDWALVLVSLVYIHDHPSANWTSEELVQIHNLAQKLREEMKHPDMTTSIVAMMESLREQGWCAVLKVIPKEMGYLAEGGHSEFDAPSEDREICKGKWCCEAEDMTWLKGGSPQYRGSHFTFGDTPQEAIEKLVKSIAQRSVKA